MTKAQLILLRQKLVELQDKRLNQYAREIIDQVKQNTINNKLERRF